MVISWNRCQLHKDSIRVSGDLEIHILLSVDGIEVRGRKNRVCSTPNSHMLRKLMTEWPKTVSDVVSAPQPTVSSTCQINSTTISHCPFKIRCIVFVLSNDLDHSHASEAYRFHSFQNSPSSLVVNGFQRNDYVAISAANCCCSRGCLSRTR